MPANLLDVFSDNAFSMVALTDAINNLDHVPGQAGELAFAGEGEGVPVTEISVEYRNRALSIIPTSPRGAPAPTETREKRSLIKIPTVHIQLEDVVHAASVQDVRAFGSSELESVQNVVNDQLSKMNDRLMLTLENLRLGALKGKILDADGSELIDLYATFGVAEPSDVEFPASASEPGSLRVACQAVSRQLFKTVKAIVPPGARVNALCGDGFFDTLVSHPEVAAVYTGWQGAQQMLAGDATRTPFIFGDIAFSNYRGTDDTGEEASEGELVGKVGIATDECRIFLTGIPGLYTEKYSPADFIETTNQIGLPRYAKLVVDPEMGRWVKLHVQSNPLPICTRPQTLLRGVWA